MYMLKSEQPLREFELVLVYTLYRVLDIVYILCSYKVLVENLSGDVCIILSY